MAFIFTFLLIVALEPAARGNDNETTTPPEPVPEEVDVCVGCDDEEKTEPEEPQLTVEILIDPTTGNVEYVIKGIVIE